MGGRGNVDNKVVFPVGAIINNADGIAWSHSLMLLWLPVLTILPPYRKGLFQRTDLATLQHIHTVSLLLRPLHACRPMIGTTTQICIEAVAIVDRYLHVVVPLPIRKKGETPTLDIDT